MSVADSSKKSTGYLGVYFYAILMALLGVLLGFLYLTCFPANAFSSTADYQASREDLEDPAPLPGDAYYIEGAVLQSDTWQLKRQQLSTLGPQTVRLSPAEINGWMADKFRAGAPAETEEDPKILIVPGVPNIAIAEPGLFYLNLPTSLTIYGHTYDYTVFSRCTLDADSGLQFQSVNISGARIPLPNLLGARLLDILVQGFQSTEEYTILSDAIARADSIQLEAEELVFDLR